ncbi:DNA ligase LigA-related protein [Selenomonas ruminantium]|uniref:DNA ligase LigA-related protein n=1 Tax=Selenomonas ruminantium TaxID=971 RepID=UPI0005A52E9C|nr:hypothetical protein [Selenomonas ruminantium]
MNLKPVHDRIRQLRLGLMLHSYIYYKLGKSIISDAKWDDRARELVRLQKKFPSVAKKVRFAKLYQDFDGSTGFHLAGEVDAAMIRKAHFLLAIEKEFSK